MTNSQIAEFSKISSWASYTTMSLTDIHKKKVAIAAKGVEMVFQSGSGYFQALKGINLDIHKGDIELLMGPSGSGKTTLLSILAGILTPTSGTIHLLNQEITSMSRRELSRFRRENIGFIFQGFNLFPALTALENVELALKC